MGGRVEASLAERTARYRRIVVLRDQGKTYEEIGALLDPPLRKQRVEAIIAGGPPKPVGRPRRAA